MRGVSLEAYDDHEQKLVISTPRSLEACYREGIDPYELLYRPPEDFYEDGLTPRIQELNFNLFEAKRKDTLTLARQARFKLIEEMDRNIQQSFSEPKLTNKASIATVAEKLKVKKLRAMHSHVGYEALANEIVSEIWEQERQRQVKEEMVKESIHQAEKARNEQRVRGIQIAEDEKEQRKSQRKDKTARKEVMQRFLAMAIEEERRRMKEQQEFKEKTANQSHSQFRLQTKVARAEKLLQERKIALEKKIAIEDYMVDIRKREIQAEQEQYRQKLQARSQEIEEKRRRAQEAYFLQYEAVLVTQKRNEFYKKKALEDARMSHFIEEQRTAISGMKLFTKDERIEKVRENAEKLAEQRRTRVQQKMELNDLRVQKQRQLMIEHQQFRKHINLLKQLKKDWNMRRKERKEQHKKELSEYKLLNDEKKVRRFLRRKQVLQRSRSAINRTVEIEEFRLREAIDAMSLTKKWDSSVLDELASTSVDHSTAPETANRPSRPRTAKV